MKKIFTGFALSVLMLLPVSEASASPRVPAQFLAAAEHYCESRECVIWVMNTTAAENCHRARAVHKNDDGSVDRGPAQINSKNPPPWHRGSVWSVDAGVRTMAEGHRRGRLARKRWVGSRRPIPAGCAWR